MTQHPLRILGVSGSLRSASYNTALLRTAGEAMPPAMELEIAPIGDLPLYNGDVEAAGFPEPVVRLRQRLAEADAALFACPEYNWSLTGALKNAIDWLSRNPASPLDHKPAAILGGGGRGGGARAQSHLREVLAHNRVQVYEESEVVVPRVWGAFDTSLRLQDDRVRDDIATLVEGLELHTRRDIANRPAVLAIGGDARRLARAYRALVADYRVVLALEPAALDRQMARWSPVAAVVDDGFAPGLGDLPSVTTGDTADLLPRLQQAVARSG